jgi:hypothetical protein
MRVRNLIVTVGHFEISTLLHIWGLLTDSNFLIDYPLNIDPIEGKITISNQRNLKIPA